jgi:hypothetical protein
LDTRFTSSPCGIPGSRSPMKALKRSGSRWITFPHVSCPFPYLCGHVCKSFDRAPLVSLSMQRTFIYIAFPKKIRVTTFTDLVHQV